MNSALQPIYTEAAECQDCYKCIRQCPVKAIEVRDGHAQIVPDLCILCGRCVRVCPVGAKRVRNDLPRFEQLLRQKREIYVSLAPSWLSEWDRLRPGQLITAIRRLGVTGVSETALGADQISLKTARDLGKTGGGLQFSSACPTVVEYLNKYRPEFRHKMASVYSPLLAHTLILKQTYGEDIAVVFIGPCIAKKREADQFPDLLELSLSFRDLETLFAEHDIDPFQISEEEEGAFQPYPAGNGHFFPVDGGMIRSINTYRTPQKTRFLSFSGMADMTEALDELAEIKENEPCFVELLACRGGCVNGPGCRTASGTLAKTLRVEKQPEAAALPWGNTENWEINREESAEEQPRYSEEEKERVLFEIGKVSPADELNCGGCGYNTCREFAEACLLGKAEKKMCVSHLRRLSEKKANALMKSMPSGVVIVDADLQIVDCNRQFALLAGGEAEAVYQVRPGMAGASLEKIVSFSGDFAEVLSSGRPIEERNYSCGSRILRGAVFSIENHRIVGGIFQDVTTPWVQRDSIIKQARNVLEKNVSTVQQIAYLLGENAAETEVMLHSILNSFEREQEDAI